MRIIVAILTLALSSSAFAVEKKKVALIKKANAQTQAQESLPSDRPSDGPVIGTIETGRPESKEDGSKEDKKEKVPPVCTVVYANGYLGMYKCDVDGTTCIVANGGSTDLHCK